MAEKRGPRGGGEERALWLAVVAQAMDDAAGINVTPAECRDARVWFRKGGPDFRQTCFLADLDPDAVRERALEVIAEAGETAGTPKRRNVSESRAQTYEHDGLALTLKQWAHRLGIAPATLSNRIHTGWPLEQALSKPVTPGSKERILTFEGETMNCEQWAARLGGSAQTLRARLRAGWSVEEALTTKFNRSTGPRPKARATPVGREGATPGVGQNFSQCAATGVAAPRVIFTEMEKPRKAA